MYGITHPDAECARPVDVGRDSRRRRDFALRCIVHGRGGCSPSVWYASRHRCRSVGQVVLSSDLSLGRILMTVIIAAGRGDASFVVALGIFAAEAERVRFCRFCGSAEQKCRLCRLKKAHAPRVVRGRSSCYAHHICAALRLRHQDVLPEPGWLNVGDEAVFTRLGAGSKDSPFVTPNLALQHSFRGSFRERAAPSNVLRFGVESSRTRARPARFDLPRNAFHFLR